jgi:hypothetical protein
MLCCFIFGKIIFQFCGVYVRQISALATLLVNTTNLGEMDDGPWSVSDLLVNTSNLGGMDDDFQT